ncbi:MAG: sugar ABC transporter permease [Chloroflexota bacterium]
MASITTGPTREQEHRTGPGAIFDNEVTLGRMMVAPAVLLILLLVAYPFLRALWLSMTDLEVARAATGNFIGPENYVNLWDRSIFREKVFVNTLVYTLGAVPIKIVLGLILALVLNRKTIPFINVLRGIVLLPWVIPASLSILVWSWMFEPTYSVINQALVAINFPGAPYLWLGRPGLAFFSVMLVNVWRGMPFFAVIYLSALQNVPRALEEAAMIDGANVIQRFRYVTLPWIMPVIMVTSLFSIVQTSGEVQIVQVLTRGGPFNTTHVLGTYAYQQAMLSGKLGEGSAISLFLFPILLLVIILQLRYLQREV